MEICLMIVVDPESMLLADTRGGLRAHGKGRDIDASNTPLPGPFSRPHLIVSKLPASLGRLNDGP
jgi:hypothetical protein